MAFWGLLYRDSYMEKLNFQARVKSAASAATPKRPDPRRPLAMPSSGSLQAVRDAALAADLITA